MSKETNGIATRDDCNSIVPGVFTTDLSRCPTKSEIISTGKLNVSGSYADNQLVKYESIALKDCRIIMPYGYFGAYLNDDTNNEIMDNLSTSISCGKYITETSAYDSNDNAGVSIRMEDLRIRDMMYTSTASWGAFVRFSDLKFKYEYNNVENVGVVEFKSYSDMANSNDYRIELWKNSDHTEDSNRMIFNGIFTLTYQPTGSQFIIYIDAEI